MQQDLQTEGRTGVRDKKDKDRRKWREDENKYNLLSILNTQKKSYEL